MPAPEARPTAPVDAPVVIVANAPGTIGTGSQRMLLGLVAADATSLAAPDLAVTFEFFDSSGSPIGSVEGAFQWTIPDTRGLYTVRPTFETPGEFEVVARAEGLEPSAPQRFTVVEDLVVPEVGEVAPAAATPTADQQPLEQISTDPEPDPRFYELSLDDALASGTPTVVVFATPAFCQSQTCGPMLDQVKAVAPDHPQVNFVHVEVYVDFQGAASAEELQVAPAVTEWGLPSEPWVYFVDGEGTVTARFEGTISPEELEEGLATVG